MEQILIDFFLGYFTHATSSYGLTMGSKDGVPVNFDSPIHFYDSANNLVATFYASKR